MSNAGTMNGLSNENQYKTVNCNVFTPRNQSTLYFILHSEYTHYTTLKFLQLSSSSALFYRLIVRYHLQRAPDSFSSWLFYNVQYMQDHSKNKGDRKTVVWSRADSFDLNTTLHDHFKGILVSVRASTYIYINYITCGVNLLNIILLVLCNFIFASLY